MLFEVTGMRLRSNEFRDNSSSDSEIDIASEEPSSIDYAFMERFSDDEDDIGQQANFSYVLNPWSLTSFNNAPVDERVIKQNQRSSSEISILSLSKKFFHSLSNKNKITNLCLVRKIY